MTAVFLLTKQTCRFWRAAILYNPTLIELCEDMIRICQKKAESIMILLLDIFLWKWPSISKEKIISRTY